ncbi:two-component response regulator [Candidatus Brocadia pituitae]|nr:two-component response regulator [Candidatus Brocadia pituitae]
MEMSKIVYTFMENELMRVLFSGVTDLTYIYDCEGNILFVNKVFEKFTGHRPEEFYGRSFATLFDEDNLKKAKDAFAETLKGKSPEYKLYFRNTRVLCEYKNFPLRDQRGSLVGVMGIARDITARRQDEEQLKALNEPLEKRVIEHTSRLMELNEELTKEMNECERLKRELKHGMEKQKKSLMGVIQTLALTVEARDPHFADHQKRVASLACCMAEEMGISKERIAGIYLAAMVHDIGRVSVSPEIFRKNGQLTESELDMMRGHSVAGYDILKVIEFSMPIAQIVLQHHERVDGSGYPDGLIGEDMLLEAKILGVADVVDAMTSYRSYRNFFALDEALQEILQNRGIRYDFNVVCACLAVFREKGFTFAHEYYSPLKSLEEILLKV